MYDVNVGQMSACQPIAYFKEKFLLIFEINLFKLRIEIAGELIEQPKFKTISLE